MKCRPEFIQQKLCARIAVRLKQHMHLVVRRKLGRRQSGFHFCRMVPIIVHNRDAMLHTAYRKPSVHTAERGQPFANFFERHFHLKTHANGGRCVQNIVHSRHIQPERAQVVAMPANAKCAGRRFVHHAVNFKIHLRVSSIGNGAPPHSREDLLNIFVFHAEDHSAVERNLVNELSKRGPDGFNGRVVVQMLAINIGDNRHNRGKLEE